MADKSEYEHQYKELEGTCSRILAKLHQQQGGGGGAGVVKRKPVFSKVNELKPGTNGNNLTVKVLSSTTVLDKKSRHTSSFSSRSGAAQTRIAECLIGD